METALKTIIIFDCEHLPVPMKETILTILWSFTRHFKSCLYHCVISWWLWVNNTGLQQLEVQHRLTESHSWVVMLKECRPHMRYSTVIQSSLCNCQHQTKAYWKPLTWQTPIQELVKIIKAYAKSTFAVRGVEQTVVTTIWLDFFFFFTMTSTMSSHFDLH